ncbi:MAG: hypothetical protein H7X71_01910 [Chitinophagales bacterium]|nr:hypothetical protein [Chitinophagales bacterium]
MELVLRLPGGLLLVYLRNYKGNVDAKGNEWMEKDGKIYLDERKNKQRR